MPPNANSIDLYALLPEAYRTEDAARGHPLRALLELASRQARLLHDDIGGLWDDCFIETCADWVIPYLGDLVGNNPLHEAGARSRADVAKTIYYRRRKGTLAVLEEIARDVTGWGAHAVEFFQLLGWTQSLNHLRLDPTEDPLRRRPGAVDRVGTAHVRDLAAMDGIDTPFDRTAHSVDVRTPRRHQGGWNLANLGFFLWRLRAYRVGRAEPVPATSNPPHPARQYRFHLHPLGVDAPLFTLADEDYSESGRATELQVPTPIRRTALHLDLETSRREAARLGYRNLPPTSRYFGHDPVAGRTRSLHLRRGSTDLRPLDLACTDLTDWERPPGSVLVLRTASLAGFTGLTGTGTLEVSAGPLRNVPVTLAGAGLTTPPRAAAALEAALRTAHPARAFAHCEVHLHANRLFILPGIRGELMTFAPAPTDSTTVTELGLDAAESFHGALSDPPSFPAPLPASPALAVTIGTDGPHALATALPLPDAPTLAARLESALRGVSATNPAFAEALALALPGERVLVLPGRPGQPIRFHPTASDPVTVERLGLATRVAVDPRLGRLTFAFGDEPADSRELSLQYAYGFSDNVGGGPYDRRRIVPNPSSATASPVEPTAEAFLASESVPTKLLLIDATIPSPPPPPPPDGPPRFGTIRDALAAWANLGRPPALIRFTDDRVYVEDVALAGFAKHTLALVAAPGCRPVLAGNLVVTATGGQGRLRLEGLWIRDQLRLEGQLGELQLLDCTLRPTTAPSVVIADSQTLLRVHIDRCLTGPWQAPPTVASLAFRRSILDAAPTATTTSGAAPTSLAAADGTAGPSASFDRVTVLGRVHVREIPLATETLFRHPITVERRQSGCLRFSYVPNLAGDPTPRRFRCQPDLALENVSDPDALDRLRTRLVPAFTSVHFGDPGYGQLSLLGPDELRTGAEDGAEIGAFHDLLQPQREANLRLRLAEYLPFGLQPGLLPQT